VRTRRNWGTGRGRSRRRRRSSESPAESRRGHRRSARQRPGRSRRRRPRHGETAERRRRDSVGRPRTTPGRRPSAPSGTRGLTLALKSRTSGSSELPWGTRPSASIASSAPERSASTASGCMSARPSHRRIILSRAQAPERPGRTGTGLDTGGQRTGSGPRRDGLDGAVAGGNGGEPAEFAVDLRRRVDRQRDRPAVRCADPDVTGAFPAYLDPVQLRRRCGARTRRVRCR